MTTPPAVPAAGWIAVDLDGTLAHYDGFKGPQHIGAPVPLMLARVRAWLAEGRDVRIFTARVDGGTVALNMGNKDGELFREVEKVRGYIEAWCLEHLGRALPVTCQKDYGMIELWDDRCVQVVPNTGQRADGAVPAAPSEKGEVPQDSEGAVLHIGHPAGCGCWCCTWQRVDKSTIAALRTALASEREARERASSERDKWYDCHAGPGTTVEACGACVTCLGRELDAAHAAESAALARTEENKKIADHLQRVSEIAVMTQREADTRIAELGARATAAERALEEARGALDRVIADLDGGALMRGARPLAARLRAVLARALSTPEPGTGDRL